MRIKAGQKIIDKLRGKKKKIIPPIIDFEKDMNLDYDNIQYKKIIVTRGFFYSGSSAVLGLLEEYKDTFVYGNHDNFFSKTVKEQANCGSEIAFFLKSEIFNFISAFKSKKLSLLEKDIIIKRFIKDIYTCYRTKQLSDWDYSPNFYNSAFLEVSLKFIEAVVSLNEYDMNILKKYGFPIVMDADVSDDIHECSFIYGKKARTHMFLKFRDITASLFDEQVSLYFHRLFNLLKYAGDTIVYDQLISIDNLDTVNGYMEDVPIKQICVYREPRDHFMSLFKNDVRGWVPRNAEDFVKWYKERINEKVFRFNPNRLIIKFEDLVLKYDETVKRIEDFVGLKPEDHIAPKSVFDPEISKVNIGAWKEFIDQDFMKKIAEALPEYCYNGEDPND